MAALLTSSPLVKTYTLEEFWNLQEPADRSKLELIAGVLYMSPPPAESHDEVAARLNDLLTAHVREQKLPGRIYLPRAAIWTSQHTYLEPNLFYLSAETEAQLRPGHRRTADWVAEILSPGSSTFDRTAKAATYFALGGKELWLVDEMEQTVEVRQAESGEVRSRMFRDDEEIRSGVFPMLRVPARQLFSD